jgi:hypothetical protein
MVWISETDELEPHIGNTLHRCSYNTLEVISREQGKIHIKIIFSASHRGFAVVREIPGCYSVFPESIILVLWCSMSVVNSDLGERYLKHVAGG